MPLFSKVVRRFDVNSKDLYTNADGPNNRLLSHEISRGEQRNGSWPRMEDVLENEQGDNIRCRIYNKKR